MVEAMEVANPPPDWNYHPQSNWESDPLPCRIERIIWEASHRTEPALLKGRHPESCCQP